MTSPTDLTQFGQWLAEQQSHLVTELWKEQQQAQDWLVKGLCDVLREQPLWRPSHETTSGLPCRLSKQTPNNDVEAFLHSFEVTALAANWPRSRWVTILGPYLTGLAQVLLKTLLMQDMSDYEKVKAAILDQYEITLETQRQWFWPLCFKIGDRLKSLITDLREYATRWLKPVTQGE